MNRGPKPSRQQKIKSSDGKPVAPIDMDNIAKDQWTKIVKALDTQGTLSSTDASIIEVFAKTYSLWHRLSIDLAGQSSSSVGKDGRIYANPLIGSVAVLSSKLASILSLLDLTPCKRGKEATTKQVISPLQALCE